MPLLLDTCIVYDWLMGAIADQSFSDLVQAEGAIVSAASVWEMAIKHNLGKLPLPSSNIADDIAAQGFQWLVIQPYHAQALLALPNHHKDPFDRLLLAQASYEGLQIATYDTAFQSYIDDVLIISKLF